ncbi:hypothetical protein chiPu_0007490 [Chiloscyllium punctatum]|uniref:Uncharacterized protein n=1 Tax=Chiloscyllium punctatum TaxID=137246 RepID=A0A401SFC9_CHIPU|nr:hypothetical protein [Chiloscyllium punctatum]
MAIQPRKPLLGPGTRLPSPGRWSPPADGAGTQARGFTLGSRPCLKRIKPVAELWGIPPSTRGQGQSEDLALVPLHLLLQLAVSLW